MPAKAMPRDRPQMLVSASVGALALTPTGSLVATGRRDSDPQNLRTRKPRVPVPWNPKV